MDRVAIIRDGQIANVVLADLETWTPPSGSTAMLESEAISQGFTRASNTPIRKTWDSPASFLGEFSMEQIAAISLSTDPTIAALRLFMAAWKGEVWSDDPRVVAGISATVSVGIITPELAVSAFGQTAP